jgi:hypothetical protein
MQPRKLGFKTSHKFELGLVLSVSLGSPGMGHIDDTHTFQMEKHVIRAVTEFMI